MSEWQRGPAAGSRCEEGEAEGELRTSRRRWEKGRGAKGKGELDITNVRIEDRRVQGRKKFFRSTRTAPQFRGNPSSTLSAPSKRAWPIKSVRERHPWHMKIPEMHAVSSRDNDCDPPRSNAALREAGAASCMVNLQCLLHRQRSSGITNIKKPSGGYCYNQLLGAQAL
jgi:hypothetical protein